MSITHWLIVAGIAALALGGGRFSALTGDIGRGLGRFRREMDRDDG